MRPSRAERGLRTGRRRSSPAADAEAGRTPVRRASWLALALVVAAPSAARAGVAEWRLSEAMLAGAGGDGQVRFVEVHTVDGGCWFPTTEVAVYDGAGTVLDAVAPFVETTCFAADTYLLLATPQAEAAFGVTGVASPPVMPAATRQMCLRSTGTRYDCVRWDGVTMPVHDLFGPDDDTVAVAPPPGLALARIAETHVVAEDWIVAEPTPGAINDGMPWDPPDAGPTPDAGPDAGPDAAVPDAGPSPDANVDAPGAPDARDDRFLGLDAEGGAGCGCAARGGGAADLLVVLAAFALAMRRRLR